MLPGCAVVLEPGRKRLALRGSCYSTLQLIFLRLKRERVSIRVRSNYHKEHVEALGHISDAKFCAISLSNFIPCQDFRFLK